MHPIGFTTGSFYKVGVVRGLEILEDSPFVTVEISLRKNFSTLIDYIVEKDFSKYDNIFFHIPKLKEVGENVTEEEMIKMVLPFKDRGWNIVLHPDEIVDFSLWEEFGSQLCVENMESRKGFGRTVEEMEIVFEKLPNASMCFDIGHAKQMDATMELGRNLCSKFYDRIKTIHFSDVTPNCKHAVVTDSILELFSPIIAMTPKDCFIILEYAPVVDLEVEIDFIRNNFPKYGIDICFSQK